jgi:hypothetical protein
MTVSATARDLHTAWSLSGTAAAWEDLLDYVEDHDLIGSQWDPRTPQGLARQGSDGVSLA